MKRIVAGLFAVAVLAFFFQNCGKAGFEDQSLLTSENASSTVDPKLAGLPVPYEVSVNQIAHMSCPLNIQAGATSPYFSWKVGAFDNPTDVPSSMLNIRPAGLQLSQKFVTEWNKVAPTISATAQTQKFKEALMSLPSVANTQLQLSFRKTSAPRTTLMTLPSTGDSPTVNFLSNLSADAIANSFAGEPTSIFNYFPAAKDFDQRSLEAGLNVQSQIGSYDAALRANYDSAFLAIGFQMPGDGNILSAPSASDDRFAYGKGYRVHFGIANPHQNTTAYPSSDSLAVVQEYDLETGYPVSGVAWDCSYKFKIVQKADRYRPVYRANHFTKINGACPTTPVNSTYCPSTFNSEFGMNAANFPNQVCPGGGAPVTGLHCEEQYWAACPNEPYTADLNNANVAFRNDLPFYMLFVDSCRPISGTSMCREVVSFPRTTTPVATQAPIKTLLLFMTSFSSRAAMRITRSTVLLAVGLVTELPARLT
jgi:hypothetical protein